jgi:hypothetical protein
VFDFVIGFVDRMPVRVNIPSALVVVVILEFSRLTTAPGIPIPDESLTTPLMLISWAEQSIVPSIIAKIVLNEITATPYYSL